MGGRWLKWLICICVQEKKGNNEQIKIDAEGLNLENIILREKKTVTKHILYDSIYVSCPE